MLTPRRSAGIALGVTLTLVAGGARAESDEPDEILRRPERLTVAVADELLGQLAPGGETLYFVSTRNETSQIFAQSLVDGRAKLLFDEDADVTWPRVSPDGRHLLYVSFGERALGQLCVRSLPDGSDRRCLADPSAVLQAEWIDRSRIAAVSRQSLHGDLRVLEVAAGSRLSARPLLDRNLTGPAVSPDGEWLVYVPVERELPTVGPAFAARGGRRLEAVRLAAPGSPATPLPIDLPGLTGQPAFARDGRSLYFVQFVSDSNHDGVVDASDDGVLYRVPFSISGGAPVTGPPEQLTEASYACEYPAPAADRLIATCARGNALDIYALPLDGEVPAGWTSDQLTAAIEGAGTRSEQQLLASRRLARETTTTARRLALLSLVMLYLDLEQYRAAEFYADHIAALRDRATAGLSQEVRALVDQRRAVRNRERGVGVETFAEQARARLANLRPPAIAGPAAITLAHVVKSEVADSIGDKTRAREELEAASPDAATPAIILEAYYARADALYRELDDREALVGVCRQLSGSAALTADERLGYARAAVRAIRRGSPLDEAAARLAHERAGLPDDSELAFALDVGRGALAIREASPPRPVIDDLVALYARQSRPGRRRALVEDAVKRASEVGAAPVLEALAGRYVADARRGTGERRAAERLYRRVMTGRAFRRAAERRFDEARADFDAVVEQTGSYDAVVGSIDMRLRGGAAPATVEAAYAKPGTPPALSRFARAYLLAQRLPALDGDDAAKVEAEALALLRASWSELAHERIAQGLRGALLHDRYLRTGDLASADRANLHYTIALELVGRSPRPRATILGQLGILHTQVGNYRIALRYLQERDRLPYADGPEGIASQLALARALLHEGHEAEAATAADGAVAMAERAPALAPYRVLARDRDALCNMAAGRFARALALYDAQMPSLDAASTERNRFVARVARAAAAVGAGEADPALGDLAEVERALNDPLFVARLKWPHASAAHVARTYRLIATGLEAKAYRDLARLDDEARALRARRAMLEERFTRTHRAEYERAAMLADSQLALNAGDRRDDAAAASSLREALAHADDLRARAHGEIDREQLDVLWLAAQLTLARKAPLVGDLPPRLQDALRTILARRDPALRAYAVWFEAYLSIFGTDAGPPPPPSPSPRARAVSARAAPSPSP